MGRLFFVRNNTGYISIAKRTDFNGYLKVFLRHNGVTKGFKMHRLVLMAFTNKWDTKLYACHRNDIKTDNRIENLYWGTPQQNSNDSARNNRHVKGSSHWCSALTEADVLYIRENYKRTSYRGSNSKELAEKFGVTKNTVVQIARRKTWRHI